MKKLKFITISFMIMSFVFMTFNTSAQTKKEVKTTEFKIKVMFDCPKAKNLIEKELLKEVGISKVVADIETKIVTIYFDGKKTDRIKINEAIEKIGFQTELTPKEKKINKVCKPEDEIKK